MALNFPASPVDGQIYYDSTSGNRYVYDAASGLWLSRSNSFYSTVETGQVIFDANDVTGGSNGLYFSTAANTLYANSINVSYDMRVRGNLYIGTNTVTITDSAIMAQTFYVMDNGSPVAVPTGTTSNAAYGVANSAFAHTNTTLTHSQAVYAAVNSAFGVVNAAFGVANATFAQVNTLSISANSYAGVMVNSANGYATSTYLPKSGGTVTGTLSVVGDFVVSGNTYQLNANTMSISDPLIYLAANNYSSDIVDIGFIANYVNTGGANVHTGLYREHTDKEYYLFQGYDKEPINNHIGALSNNMTLSVLNADIRTSNLNLGGANAIVWIKSAYDTVNAAYTSSNADFTVSNAAFGQVNTLATSANAYAASVGSSANAFAAATYSTLTQLGQNWAVTNAAFGVANTVTNYLPLSGGTMSGALNIGTSTNLSFGNQTRQMINLWSTNYGIGVQGSTTYFRSDSSFGWFRGGTHSDTFMTPGTGGTLAMQLDSGSHLTAYGSMRSPIFYDSDNTGYYVDPASTTNLNGLTVAGTITGSITGSAGSVGGLSVHSGRNNEANKVVRTDGNGYIQAGWINTDSGDSGIANRLTRIYSSNDNYMRYSTLTDFKAHMSLSAKNNYSRRIDYTSDANYHVGSIGHSEYGANETFHGGSAFFDIWNGTNYPSGTSHIHGFNALHYTTNSLGSTGGSAYGIQVAGQYNQDGVLFLRGCTGGTFSTWRRFMTEDIWHNNKLFASDGIIYSNSSMRTPIFYDYNDTSYYANPNGLSSFAGIDCSSANYNQFRTWTNLTGTHGFYSSSINGAHFYPNNGTYGAWRIDGSRNGWNGIEFAGHTTLMMNDNAQGFHRNTGGGWRFYVESGSGYFPGNVSAYWSDGRLKENLRPIGREAIDIINKFTTYRFNWNNKVEEFELPIEVGKEEIGMIAQDVQQVLPDAVTINKSACGSEENRDYLTINYDRITPILAQALKETVEELNELKQLLKDKGIL